MRVSASRSKRSRAGGSASASGRPRAVSSSRRLWRAKVPVRRASASAPSSAVSLVAVTRIVPGVGPVSASRRASTPGRTGRSRSSASMADRAISALEAARARSRQRPRSDRDSAPPETRSASSAADPKRARAMASGERVDAVGVDVDIGLDRIRRSRAPRDADQVDARVPRPGPASPVRRPRGSSADRPPPSRVAAGRRANGSMVARPPGIAAPIRWMRAPSTRTKRSIFRAASTRRQSVDVGASVSPAAPQCRSRRRTVVGPPQGELGAGDRRGRPAGGRPRADPRTRNAGRGDRA